MRRDVLADQIAVESVQADIEITAARDRDAVAGIDRRAVPRSHERSDQLRQHQPLQEREERRPRGVPGLQGTDERRQQEDELPTLSLVRKVADHVTLDQEESDPEEADRRDRRGPPTQRAAGLFYPRNAQPPGRPPPGPPPPG